MTLTDSKATTDQASGTVRRVLQRVVLPADRDMDVLPLYLDRENAQLDLLAAHLRGSTQEMVKSLARAGTMARQDHLDPQAILDRRRIVVRAGQRVSFGAYFNAFPASYWRRWSIVEEIHLQVRVSGAGASVTVYKSTPDGRSQRVDLAQVDESGAGEFDFTLPLKPFVDGGWYWFDLVAGDADATLEGAEWVADVPAERAQSKTMTVGITTMNRPTFCVELLEQLSEDDHILALLDEVLLVDQGTQKAADADGFTDAAAGLGDRLRVIDQANIGGSGGFARVQYETLQSGRSDYVVFLDDDIQLEPESLVRAGTFADLARRPTIVGGHMFSLYSKSRLHSFGEVVNRWRFWWESPTTVETDWDFAARNLRSTRWLHRRIDVDFNPWFFCLIPVEVVREIGLSLPLFIKWDDAEYGLRASAAGFPTVTFPGVAVWHVPWTDKNDGIDWQIYFHTRNRLVAALLHSPYERGGRLVRENLLHALRHLFTMQYSTVELRYRAVEDVLAGPGHLHPGIGTTLPELHALRKTFADSSPKANIDQFPSPRRKKPPKRGNDVSSLRMSKPAQVLSAGKSVVRQMLPPREMSREFPEAAVSAMDAAWWIVAKFDSVLLSMPDGTSAAFLQRDPEMFKDQIARTAAIHRRLFQEWPRLVEEYRAALGEITSPEAWAETFSASSEEVT